MAAAIRFRCAGRSARALLRNSMPPPSSSPAPTGGASLLRRAAAGEGQRLGLLQQRVYSSSSSIASNRFMSSSPLQEENDETKKKKRMEEKNRRKKLAMALMKEQPSPSSSSNISGDEQEMKSIEELFGLLQADIRSPQQIKRVQELRSAVEEKKEELVRLLLKDHGHGDEQEIKEKTEELAAAGRRLWDSLAPQGQRILMKRCESLEETRDGYRLAGNLACMGIVGLSAVWWTSVFTHFLLK